MSEINESPEAETAVVATGRGRRASAEATPAPVARTKRVIVQRPYGNTDSHIHLGFNAFEGIFPFDEPIELPADMVDYFRTQKRAEFFANESGSPSVSRSNLLNIMDA